MRKLATLALVLFTLSTPAAGLREKFVTRLPIQIIPGFWQLTLAKDGQVTGRDNQGTCKASGRWKIEAAFLVVDIAHECLKAPETSSEYDKSKKTILKFKLSIVKDELRIEGYDRAGTTYTADPDYDGSSGDDEYIERSEI